MYQVGINKGETRVYCFDCPQVRYFMKEGQLSCKPRMRWPTEYTAISHSGAVTSYKHQTGAHVVQNTRTGTEDNWLARTHSYTKTQTTTHLSTKGRNDSCEIQLFPSITFRYPKYWGTRGGTVG